MHQSEGRRRLIVRLEHRGHLVADDHRLMRIAQQVPKYADMAGDWPCLS